MFEGLKFGGWKCQFQAIWMPNTGNIFRGSNPEPHWQLPLDPQLTAKSSFLFHPWFLLYFFNLVLNKICKIHFFIHSQPMLLHSQPMLLLQYFWTFSGNLLSLITIFSWLLHLIQMLRNFVKALEHEYIFLKYSWNLIRNIILIIFWRVAWKII